MANKLANIVGSGTPPSAGTQINGNAFDSLTAAGSTQGTALLLPGDYNVFTTTAASTGTVFPTNTQPGDEIFIMNLGANSLSVYPASGESINALSANAAYSLATTKSAYFVKTAAGRWVTLLSA